MHNVAPFSVDSPSYRQLETTPGNDTVESLSIEERQTWDEEYRIIMLHLLALVVLTALFTYRV